MLKKVILIFLLMPFSFVVLYSQCDCPGNIPAPIMTISSGAVNNARIMQDKGEIYISGSYKYIYGNHKFEGDKIVDNTFRLKHNYSIYDVGINYGISNSLNISFAFDHISGYSEDIYVIKDNYTQSASVSIKYNIFSKESDDELIVFAGNKLPVTKSSIDTGGASGIYNNSNSVFVGLLYNYLISSKLNLIMNLYKDFNFTRSFNIKQGDAVSGSLMLKMNNLYNFSPVASLDFSYAGKNKFEDKEIYSSGYISLFATASVSYFIPKWFASAGLSFSCPLYRYYNGYQNSQDYMIQFNLGLLIP